MANSFGNRSLGHLSTCHPDLQRLAYAVLELMNISVLEGERSLAVQQLYYVAGKSKVRRGKHNTSPSRAVHFAPYPYQQTDMRPYYYLGGLVRAVAQEMGIRIVWGGDWDMDGDIYDQTFNDLMHFELEDDEDGTTD